MNNPHSLLIDELKDKLDIIEVVSKYVVLKRNGPGYEGSCPFHEDTNDSFYVNPGDQTWLCSSGCSASRLLNNAASCADGDVISFVACVEDLGLGQAVRRLAARHGLISDHAPEEFKDEEEIVPRSGILMAPAYKIPALSGDGNIPFSNFLLPEDPDIKIGNLAYRGRVGAFGPAGNTQEYRRFLRGSQPRPGIVVALHTTLQTHCQLEYPTGDLQVFDAVGCYDAGGLLWPKKNAASAILKDLNTGSHIETEVFGVTTRGFCLLVPPGSDELMWCWPKGPRSAGGRPRPIFYKSGEEDHVKSVQLESFTVKDQLLTEYHDLSGTTVPIIPAKRIQGFHRDYLDTRE